jgi:CRISPR-associated endonuclease/helicase Cas3
MMPWVKGWGADVEVLQPEWMREEIFADAVEQIRIYDSGRKKDQ